MFNPEVQLFRGRPLQSSLSNIDILYHTQNELISDLIQSEVTLPVRDPGVGDYDSTSASSNNHQVLSGKYDGILLRHDLEPRIKQAREALRRLKDDYCQEPSDGKDDTDDGGETARREFREQFSFIFDTFDRLETARRMAASQLLAEKHNFRQTKDSFLRTRTYLLERVTQDIHEGEEA
ncbi:hypothetical protein RvY_18079 [Ramazzottius varieornatus]|uniref:Uncharacterized protein n=1 Tax=Ramazzottius varieornatus TaxID=947166 RepID=A0A1D1W9V1_RAMVA|nr:hypothetical protein RvY_18079 [Ramazzottius varieornatus]